MAARKRKKASYMADIGQVLARHRFEYSGRGRLLQQHKDSNRTLSEELESLLSEHKNSDKTPAEVL